MAKWLHLVVLVVLIGVSKGHHLIRIVILAALGLAGLWMIHTLAQDYQNIAGSSHGGGGGGGGGNGGKSVEGNVEFSKFFSKRSIENDKPPEINWNRVLSRDPAGCARSFVCQLSAQKVEELSAEERLMLDLVKRSAENGDSWASKELQYAIKNGIKVDSPVACKKFYRFCPYSSKTMMALLQMFGGGR